MVIIIDSFTRISRLFYKHPNTPEWDLSFINILELLGRSFSDPSRSGQLAVTKDSCKELGLRCAEVVFDPAWYSKFSCYLVYCVRCIVLSIGYLFDRLPSDGSDDCPRDADLVNEVKAVALECLSLALPKASKSRKLANLL
jgi:hypothetical protein